MASVRVDIISIGTLGRNLLWNEGTAVRTPHATCSLLRAGKRNVLVDPGLPGAALAARLFERTGLRPAAIDTIFLTNARPAHRGGLAAFPQAKVLMHERERDATAAQLRDYRDATDDRELRAAVAVELAIIEATAAAPDTLLPQVDLFPLFGYTLGTCGLIVAAPASTTLIAGDAVASLDHFLAGQVLPDSADLAAAKESLAEVYEIADLIIPGHDNGFVNPRNYSV